MSNKVKNDPKIHIAFRFHGNFYHSYRGDTPDELGFGKDIRIIRHLLDTLDDYNKQGISLCGTWDYENYFSLEKIMPEHCPELIERIQGRVSEGKDEIEIMSYNNGLVSASNAKEFEAAIKLAITNEAKSGVKEIFGAYKGIVRPQETMYTPIHLKLYNHYGIHSISLFYSALPFNTFSNFVPRLSFEEQYNPLTLTYEGIQETMTLLPAYNTGDIIDHITLRKWVKSLRKKQMQMANPKDLLLLLDMDADDEFWVGIEIPVISWFYSTFKGLKGLVDNILDLDYIVFTTPGRYLENHPAVGKISFGQDTADGSFDGISSWAEKWSNQQIWTGIDRSRLLEAQTHFLLKEDISDKDRQEIQSLIDQSFNDRVKLLSTTHFGMSSPVMNITRLKIAADLAKSSVDRASKAWQIAVKAAFKLSLPKESFVLMDYPRGVSTEALSYVPHSSKSLITLKLKPHNLKQESAIQLLDGNGSLIPAIILHTYQQSQLMFVDHFQPEEKKQYKLQIIDQPVKEMAKVDNPVRIDDRTMSNAWMNIHFDNQNQVNLMDFENQEYSKGNFINSAIQYNGKLYYVYQWEIEESKIIGNGLFGYKRMKALLPFASDTEKNVEFVRELLISSELPYIYIQMQVRYPQTEFKKYNKERAPRLEQKWDGRWEEVRPCEISPNLLGTDDHPIRVWKHNYFNHISGFSLDYYKYSSNKSLDSINNQITNGWVAVSNGIKGIMVAQTAEHLCSLAFCPMRTKMVQNQTQITLNPFGSYYGKQYRYDTAYSGLGRALALISSDHLDPYAPSYNGKLQSFALMIAPYTGDQPPSELVNNANAYSYPYLMVSNSDILDVPNHHSWEYTAKIY